MSRVAAVLIVILGVYQPGAAAPLSAAAKDKIGGAEALTAPATEQPRAGAALALIEVPWQQLKYEIVFLAPQRGYRAMTIADKHRIEIYARPEDDFRLLAYDIAHELGHAIDLTVNTNKTRAKWMKARGIDPATPWFGCNRCSDYNTPAGDFAETFALLLLGPGNFSGRIAPAPTSEQIRTLTSFFPEGFFRAEGD